MLRFYFNIAFIYLLILSVSFSCHSKNNGPIEKAKESVSLYRECHLDDAGLSNEIFNLALKGLKTLESKGVLKNPNLLTIADYSQSSNHRRLYVIDIKEKKLLFNTYVAHGRNSGEEFARSFSNLEGSFKSSLGFFITAQTINAPHTGFSLVLNGVEDGFNDNALKRAIIIHGAEYVSEYFIKKYGRLGRSLGCPALPLALSKTIINRIENGSCLFLYYPDPDYLKKSQLIN